MAVYRASKATQEASRGSTPEGINRLDDRRKERTDQEAGRRWGHCAREAGWGLNRLIQAMGDRAEWIRLQSQEIFGNQATFLCDFFHVSEYLGAAAQTCRPGKPNNWRRTQEKRLKRGALLQARLKKSGAAWLKDHTDQIAHLRVLRANLHWDAFWN